MRLLFGRKRTALIALVVLSNPGGVSLAQELIQVLQVVVSDDDPLFGSAIASVGDVNGDGFADTLVGAFRDDTVAPAAGSAWVLSGKDGTVLFVTHGSTDASNLGWSLAGPGDVDADGFPDIAVGDRAWYSTIYGQGLIRVHSGKTGAAIHQIPGDSHLLQLGNSLGHIGDLNADGRADVLAGSRHYYQVWGTWPGIVKVYSGLDGSELLSKAGPPDPALWGSGFGEQVAGMGDVDGDGVPDIAVGAPFTELGSSAGRIQVLSGSSGGEIYSIFGSNSPGAIGGVLAAVGDVDGDGILDIGSVIGGTGLAHVFSGMDGSFLRSLVGTQPNTAHSRAIDAVGDYDGDGLADIIVGKPGSDFGGPISGSAEIFSGGSGALLTTLIGSAGSGFGDAVSTVGDTNNDGRDDFAVGAYGVSSNQGAVYVYSGNCSSPVYYGTGCAGLATAIPTLSVGETCIYAGIPIAFHVAAASPNATAFIAFGTQQANLPVGNGCSLLVAPLFPTLVALPIGPSGTGLFFANIPVFLKGHSITMQAIVPDPGGSGKFATSSGMELNIP